MSRRLIRTLAGIDASYRRVAGAYPTGHHAALLRIPFQAALDLELPDGFSGEVNLAIGTWMRRMSDALERGFVVTIDYGYPAKVLYNSDRSTGTLKTYYRHAEGGNPYVHIGRQDMTAHVDFSLIASEGQNRAGKMWSPIAIP